MLPPWLFGAPAPGSVLSSFPALQYVMGAAGSAVPAGISVSRATHKLANLGASIQTEANNVGAVEVAGLVIEPAHTNLLHFSQGFSTPAWTAASNGAVAPVVTDAFATAPDGTLTASKVVLPAVSGSGNYSVIYQAVTAANGVGQLWVKGASGSGTIYLCGTPDGATYDKVTCNYNGSTWTHFTFTTSNTNPFVEIGVDLRDGTQSAQGAQTVLIWQADYSATSWAESQIPTTNASATCNADVVTSGATASFPTATGTIYTTFTPEWGASPPSGGAFLLDTRASTPGTTVGLAIYVDSAGKLSLKVGAQTAVQSSALTWTAGTAYTIRATWANGVIMLYRNGTQVATASGQSLPTSHSAVAIGSDSTGANQLSGRLASLIVYGA